MSLVIVVVADFDVDVRQQLFVDHRLVELANPKILS